MVITESTLRTKIADGLVTLRDLEMALEDERRWLVIPGLLPSSYSSYDAYIQARARLAKNQSDACRNIPILETLISEFGHARKCMICGNIAEMNASKGPACPEHYDQLS